MNIKFFFITLFFKQNKWHRHGVLIHTLRVAWYALKDKEYSFTDHEEASYQIIKNWPFISEYTKEMTRYHYLIRDIIVSKNKNKLERLSEKQKIWDSLSEEMKSDLNKFIIFDDKAKV